MFKIMYYPQYKNNYWSSIIEVIVVIVIITIWLVGAYWILNSWSKLALTSENRIKAINIAREWIEAVKNIRDTNWIKFSSDYTNCWNVKDYDATCISDNSINKLILSWSYTISQNWDLWHLSKISDTLENGSFSWVIKNYPVYFDENWLSTQTWSYTKRCNSNTSTWCVSIFSREILVDYPDTGSAKDKKIKISSKVKWVDWSKTWSPYEVNLSTILTNWKEKL